MEKKIPWRIIINHLKGEHSPEDDILFQKWISNKDNEQLFDEIKQLWLEIRTDASQHDPDVSYYWKIMESRINGNAGKKHRTLRISLQTVASVACIVLIAVLSFFYFNTNTPGELNTYSVMNGKSRITLPDSSTVWLNSGSTISYRENFSKNRHIDMQGEASFDVKEDAKHPFIVHTYGIDIKVYGTYFNIDSYENNENITVTLRDGSVALIIKDKESLLKPGEKAVVNKKDQTLSIVNADLEYELFWANKSVYFEGKSLGYICNYLEKWYHTQIDVDPDIAEKQFYTFKVEDDPLEVILRIMAKINPIYYSFDKDNNVKITKVKP